MIRGAIEYAVNEWRTDVFTRVYIRLWTIAIAAMLYARIALDWTWVFSLLPVAALVLYRVASAISSWYETPSIEDINEDAQ